MSLNSTPSSQRLHIGFFGKRNAGKSSLVNAITGQNLAIVSDIKGTTTDPVYKSMELLPLGPITIVDTPGLDDEGDLGLLRIEKTKEVLRKIDIALLVVDITVGISELEEDLIQEFRKKEITHILAYNKCDLICTKKDIKSNEICVSAKNNINIYDLKELISKLYNEKKEEQEPVLIKDKIEKYDSVFLVTPIDSSAPKGRLILPQQQVIRELLDAGAITTVVQETELKKVLETYNKPKLVITDSQAFKQVSKETPNDVLLTSFSILFARYKGILEYSINGVNKIKSLKDNDNILISEGCTHHRQCNDIGTVKIPKWIQEYTQKQLNFDFTSGGTFPDDLSKYSMIIHCGGCMLKDNEVLYRYKLATEQNIPIANYGITIAYLNNILKRSIEIFPQFSNKLN